MPETVAFVAVASNLICFDTVDSVVLNSDMLDLCPVVICRHFVVAKCLYNFVFFCLTGITNKNNS